MYLSEHYSAFVHYFCIKIREPSVFLLPRPQKNLRTEGSLVYDFFIEKAHPSKNRQPVGALFNISLKRHKGAETTSKKTDGLRVSSSIMSLPINPPTGDRNLGPLTLADPAFQTEPNL